jgi:hypothetical protein
MILEIWAGCMSLLTQLVCTPASPLMNLLPVLLTWYSTSYNRRPLHTIATYKYCYYYFVRVGQGNELNMKHLLQLPLKLTLSARQLHFVCCLSVLKHLTLL